MISTSLTYVGLFLMGCLVGLFGKQIMSLPEKVSDVAFYYVLVGLASIVSCFVVGWLGIICVFVLFFLYHMLETKQINFSFSRNEKPKKEKTSLKTNPVEDAVSGPAFPEEKAPTSRSGESE